MSYSRKVYVKAASALERRRSKAERTQSMHREEAYAKIPELISIDREISSAGAEVIRAIGMGENAQRFIEELSKKNLACIMITVYLGHVPIRRLRREEFASSKKTVIPRIILTRTIPARNAAIRGLSAA